MAKRTITITEIDADTWAESGGTGGIFGQKWREGRLRIVDAEPPEYEPIMREIEIEVVPGPRTADNVRP